MKMYRVTDDEIMACAKLHMPADSCFGHADGAEPPFHTVVGALEEVLFYPRFREYLNGINFTVDVDAKTIQWENWGKGQPSDNELIAVMRAIATLINHEYNNCSDEHSPLWEGLKLGGDNSVDDFGLLFDIADVIECWMKHHDPI